MQQDRKKLLLSTTLALVLGLYGCGSSSSGNSTDSTAASTNEAKTEETKESGLRSEEFKDVTLVDNDIVKITLEKFYQKETNWVQSDGTLKPTTTNEIVVKVKDKTDYGSYVTADSYLDDEKLYTIGSGNNSIEAGKAVTQDYTIGKDTQPDWTPLDSFDDLYKVSLAFQISKMNENGAIDGNSETKVEVNLGDAIEGKTTATDSTTDTKSEDASKETSKKEEVAPKALNVGDVISNDNWEVTLVRTELTDEVLPNDTSSYYWSYEAGDGTAILDLVFDVKVLASKSKSLKDMFGGARATYAGKYEFENIEWYYDDEGGHLKNAARVAFDPLQTWQIHYMICGIPEEAMSNEESLKTLIRINGDLYEYVYR